MMVDAEDAGVIRPAVAADLPAIERALLAADLPVEGVAAALGQFVVADGGAGLCGAAGMEWHGDDALLRSVVVDTGARGTGVGRALVAALVDRAAARGVDGVFLLTTDGRGLLRPVRLHAHPARGCAAGHPPVGRVRVDLSRRCDGHATSDRDERKVRHERDCRQRPSAKRCARSTPRRRCASTSPRPAVAAAAPRPAARRTPTARSARRATRRATATRCRPTAVEASLGCGNPTAVADLRRGRGRARPRLGRRHRRAALGAPRRPDRQGVRAST